MTVEAFFLQGIVLGKSRLIDKVHSLVNGVADILVIRGKGEKQVVEHVNVGLGLYIQRHLLGCLLDEDRYITVQHINLLVCIIDHLSGRKHGTETDDNASCQEHGADNGHKLNLVLYIL